MTRICSIDISAENCMDYNINAGKNHREDGTSY